MRKFKEWFTLERRQGILLFAGSVAPLLILFGFGSKTVWEQWLIILGVVLQFVSSLLSLLNLKVGEWGAGWAIIRGAIYALGAGAAPALVALGIWDNEFSSYFMLGLALFLAALSNLVSLLTGSKQELQASRGVG